MNQENFNYLKDQVKYAGFGDGLESQLKEKIEAQQPSFQLPYNHEFGKDQVQASLNFRKSESADRYFFNSYEITIKPHKEEESIAQTFYIGKANNYTLKEAYNLMAGRAVYKELEKLDKVGEGTAARFEPNGEKYKAWVQLDFKNTDDRGNYKLKSYHENYGFNLQDALQKLPIQQLNNDKDREELIRSLEKGNRQFVTFTREDGGTENRYVQANPQYKSITVFDANLKRVRLDLPEAETSQNNGQSAKQEQKKAESQAASEKKSKRSKVKL
ncbi:MAG: hypothetical protein JSU01_00705 [Bacteroidetes bacterium]|nr:hypothetical protein [Bacteroidota bacterium]